MIDLQLGGRAVLVTGAASGLGRATALAFANAGAKVALADINAPGLDETAQLIAAAGGEAKVFLTDLSDAAACVALVESTVAAFGAIDAIASVAGLLHLARAETITVAEWDKVFAINTRAPFLLFQTALPHLLASEGAVVFVASASAKVGHPYLAAYASSKGALITLTKSLAVEYSKTPIRINAILPGPMNTPMATSGAGKAQQDYDMQLLMRGAGLRPMSEPDDLTDMILYLASSRNRKVHGAAVAIDQGVTA